ncbi:MAG TPA: amidohydrolase family protein [Vicinamibacterales bacterium]|nr:amidohydrolase family protein [Vicinamibacterales bacterium]
MIWQRAVALVNATVVTDQGLSDSVRFTSRILSIGERPCRTDLVIDAADGFVLPGLINAHDHLELNHYRRLKFAERYCNASEWIEDMRPRLQTDPAIREAQAKPLADRVFIGAIKNILSGVTTVAHHNPFYRELRGLPLRVLRRYGWAHSFYLQDGPAGARGEPGGNIRSAFEATPHDAPFFVHLGEGVDAAAHDELRKLAQLGALVERTVLVHGVAIDRRGWRRVADAGASLVWCPASNNFLFGQTIDFTRFVGGNVALGTDSRLTGSRDLLEELRIAYESSMIERANLLPMVTTTAANVIRQPQLGRLQVGGPADLILVPRVGHDPIDAVLATSRRDLDLVVLAGRVMTAGLAHRNIFAARRVTPQVAVVDEVSKYVDPVLATRIAACSIHEPGVSVA